MALGVRQKALLYALNFGAEVWEECGTRIGKSGRSAVGFRRAYYLAQGNEVEVPVDVVESLIKRGKVRYEGKKPRINCFDPSTRRVRVVLNG